MFGYLNLNDPRDIADNEAQEANNCRVDGGKLQYASWAVDATRNRSIQIPVSGVPTTYRINDTGFGAAVIVRDDSGFSPLTATVSGPGFVAPFAGTAGTGDSPGVAAPASVPTTTVFPYLLTPKPYPPGTYQYAITIEDLIRGEESAPAFLNATVSSDEVVEFGAWASLSFTTKFRGYRLYRRPLGSTEFLFVQSVPAGTASGLIDATSDGDLGDPLETAANIPIGSAPDSDGKATHIVWFREKLFWLSGNRLWFSKTGEPGFTQADFFFVLEQGGTDVVVKDEALYVFTPERVLVLYGDDELDFVLKEVGSPLGASSRSAGLCADNLNFAEAADYTITVGGAARTVVLADSVQSLAGNAAHNISMNVQTMFPLAPVSTTGSADDLQFVIGTVSNRFWVLRHSKLAAYVFTNETAFVSAASVVKYLVLDQLAQGFLTADSGTTFQYRTKEFAKTGTVSQFKSGWVVAEGTFDLEIYGDGVLLTTHTYTAVAKARYRFTVKSTRCNTFSFRFVGNTDAIIYEYGRLE